MNLLDLIETNLLELRLRYTADESDGVIIAFRGDYWLLGEWDNEVPETVIADIAEKTGVKETDLVDLQAYEVMDYFRDYGRPDVIAGTIQGGELAIPRLSSGAEPHPIVSAMLKKIVDELNLKGVTTEVHSDYGDDGITTDYTHKNNMGADLPSVLYHGTSSDRFEQILRVGLHPNRSDSNWLGTNIDNSHFVYGAVTDTLAEFHANRTSGYQMGNGESHELDDPFPVVFSFKVPDKNLLIPDYDVASDTIGQTPQTDALGYTGQSDNFGSDAGDISRMNPEGRVWKSASVFGYNGWISPSHIIAVVTPFFDGPFGDTQTWRGPVKEYPAALAQETRNMFGDEEDSDEDY